LSPKVRSLPTGIVHIVRIHAIQTGTVAVKRSQREGVGTGNKRLLNTFLDREWTEPLPILAWAIEHAEGVIVVDTGETARATEPRYFPRWHPYFRSGLRENLAPEDEIGPQLVLLGINPLDVRWVVMTHLHTDHAGGLRHFPQSEILVTRRELDRASGWRGQVRGYVSNRFPRWFAPRALDLDDEPFGPFPHSRILTRAGDVRLVAVPGHTPGQMAVIVREDDDEFVFLAGDSSYSQELMVRGVVDGVSPDDYVAQQTLDRIRSFTARQRVVYLPSHDPESVDRLVTRAAVFDPPLGARARVAA
jgi:glyoxylase-like metal-dependent hydrolase (beta-lactamase superfamily II)